jgi:RimJ/RimL family protein N-acetyltransferase
MWHRATVTITFRSILIPADGDAAAQFLSSNSWPYHSRAAVSADEAAQIELASESVASYWILDGGVSVGLVRLLDLDDIDRGGSPLFDVRIGEAHRGRGIGTRTVNWLTGHLFVTHPALHRIEATTRADNVAMRSVFERCRFVMEGEFREAWPNEDGTRSNTLAYAILRSDWARTSTVAAD